MNYMKEWKEIEVNNNRYTIQKLNVLDVLKAMKLADNINAKDFLYVLGKGCVSISKKDLEHMPFNDAMELVTAIIEWSVEK